MKKELLKIAQLLQFNSKAESEAMMFYTELLGALTCAMSTASGDDLEMLSKQFEQISEFISDEQNHLEGNQKMYTEITGIIAATT